MADEVACIVCDKRFRAGDEAKFKRLPHFEDAVLCAECLRREVEGASGATVEQKR